MIELGVLASVPAVGRSREWCVVSEQCVCPQCGHLVDVPTSAQDAAEAVIASMSREIRQLRETVALLRGARAG
jgi:hypothetical protein